MVPENAANPLNFQDSLSPSILNFKNLNGLDVESYCSTSSFQASAPLETLSFSGSSSIQASSQPPFTSGVFTVGSTGQVGIDYLFDGGGYQGELAIFSLQGLESFGLGTPEFIREIARRALSHSTLGYVVISDQTEGARFSSELPWEGDFNAGDYLGVRTFAMRPGDTFGVAIVPNGTFQQVFDNSDFGCDQLPLFSFNTANPNGGVQAGLIGDVTGEGHTFAFEDLRLDGESDRDYNDIVFQVRGAVGQAGSLDQLIDPNRDWRTLPIGQALLAYAAAYDAPKTTQTIDYNFPQSSQPLIGIIDTGFSANNPDVDYSRLILGSDRIGNDNNPLLAPSEGNEHGTHILGIIGATRNNGIGIDGINDKAPIWLGRAIGSGQWADALAEFVAAYIASNQPNAVVNLSLDLTQKNPDGSITTRYEFTPAERAAIEFARQHNVVLVVAAGNDGGVMSALGQASQEFDNIITVGAADGLNRADYSSYGNGLDILAPGGTTENGILSTVGDGVGTLVGTSVATAQVTGAISQVWAANPKLSYRQVIEIVKLTATDLNTPDWDAETGAGLLNIAAAVELAKATQPQVHKAPASIIPDTWTGEGTEIPFERAVGSFNYPIRNEFFKGQVGPEIGVNLRYSPWFDDRGPLNEPFGKTLSFDAWTYGERGIDLWLGTPDELWYRVAGTNYWVPSAYIYGYPGSLPPVLAPALPNPNPNPNPTPIVPINVDSANYRDGKSNPFAYNRALIGQCTWYAYGRMLETGLLPKDAKRRSLFLGNAATWESDARNAGLPVSNTPVQGARGLVVFPPGVRGAHAKFGHVAFLEEVYPDGRIRISESNWNGIQQPTERILTPAQYSGLKFVQLENARLNPSTSAPPAIPGQSQQYIIKSGDTLSGIAKRYLGNANRWREIKKPDGSTFTDDEARRLQIGSSVYLPVAYKK
jgi:surface antigen